MQTRTAEAVQLSGEAASLAAARQEAEQRVTKQAAAAHSLQVSNISKIVLDCLSNLYKALEQHTINNNFVSALSICIKTKDTIHQTNQALTTISRPMTSMGLAAFNFEGLYTNLDARTCIYAID